MELLNRGLMIVLGYAYPAYECFKCVEENKTDVDQLRFWCQYWIIVAMLTVFERAGDDFVSWLPMYGEAKVALFVYLWHSKTKGTTYVYQTFVRPYVSKHEGEFDRHLVEFRARAGGLFLMYWQCVARYGHARFFEILEYLSSQSSASNHPQNNKSEAQLSQAEREEILKAAQVAIPHPPPPEKQSQGRKMTVFQKTKRV
ncbi:hypothetical protein AMTRI_Chr11g152660 [Amborella trichopoda]